MALRGTGLRELEATCLGAGIRPASRPGALRTIGPDAFVQLLHLSYNQEGDHFLRHAGYHCGTNLAREFVGVVRHPSEGAERLIEVLASAFPKMQVVSQSHAQSNFEFSIQTGPALSPASHQFAWGFLRGAATRLNEGAMPFISERFEPGHKTWVVAVDWTRPALPPEKPAKGGKKTPHK